MKIKKIKWSRSIRNLNDELFLSENTGNFNVSIRFRPGNRVLKWHVSVFDTESDVTYTNGRQASFAKKEEAELYAQAKFEEWVTKNFLED